MRMKADYKDNMITLSWEEMKKLVIAIEFDVQRNVRGNLHSGIRVRKGLRDLCRQAHDLIKIMKLVDNKTSEQRKKQKKILNLLKVNKQQ